MRSRFAPLRILTSFFLALFSALLFGQSPMHDPDSFACRSSHYMLDDFESRPSVPSPDKLKAVELTKEYNFRVSIGKILAKEFIFPEMSCNIEVGWSPDSSQFFISYSGGGAIGRYHVHLYQVAKNSIAESHVPTVIARHFSGKHSCESRGNNLFFLDWTPDSSLGFFVAEVYPTGDCGKEAGVFRGYAVKIEDGRIVRVFGEKETDSIEKNCRASGRLVLPNP